MFCFVIWKRTSGISCDRILVPFGLDKYLPVGRLFDLEADYLPH